MKKILIISDNEYLLNQFKEIINDEKFNNYSFDFRFSYSNNSFIDKYQHSDWLSPIDVKNDFQNIIDNYSMVVSLHCKQLFPEKLVNAVKCINVHPGLNPYNRGWYPQVFSIINKMPIGATIHEIDEHLDNGPIIVQKETKIECWDTSLSLYNKVQLLEIELLKTHLYAILENDYIATNPLSEGNLNLKKDFTQLCKLDPGNQASLKEHINLLRALSHGDFKNAYFYDENGNKIFIKISLIKEESDK
jgi:methionyl-tRNA formyltransferase